VSGDAARSGRMPAIAVTFVAAVAENGIIGRGGAMPWRLKSDMRHFRAVTMGKPVVMGRKTFESIGNPLRGRTNIVVTRDPTYVAAGAVVASSLAAALATARGDALRRGADEIPIIGGGEIYSEAIAIADRLIITEVHLKPEGDTRFPSIDAAHWHEVSRERHAAAEGDAADFSIVIYERRGPPD
jgi:dihydrofolate reductase